MNKILALGAALFVFASATLHSAPPQTSAPAPSAQSSPLLTAAEELLGQVSPENSAYKHQAPDVHWSTDPSAPARCNTDCSGLLIALFERYDPKRFDGDAFKRWLDARRPTARRFYDAIEAEKGFRRIAKISDAQPGDLITMKYQPGEESTGHAMLIAEKPQRAEKPTPTLVDGTEQWLVTVLDQSKSGHGATDTRRTGAGSYRGGLGKGVFRVYAKPDGTLAGYTWSTFGNSKFYGDEDRVLAIGRFDAGFKP